VEQTENAIVKFEWKPLARVANPANLKALLESERFSRALIKILPTFSDDADPKAHVTRLVTQAALAFADSTTLYNCTQMSVFLSMIALAETGLSLSKQSGESYLVPFKDNKQGITTCTFMPGYRGILKLAYQTGAVKCIRGKAVYQGESFQYEEGLTPALCHTPDLDMDRSDGNIIYVYTVIDLIAGGTMVTVMNRGEVETIRQGASSRNSPAWKYHWGEMGIKTCLKRGIKLLPQSTSNKAVGILERAIELDNRAAGFVEAEVMEGYKEQRQKEWQKDWDERMAAEPSPIEQVQIRFGEYLESQNCPESVIGGAWARFVVLNIGKTAAEATDADIQMLDAKIAEGFDVDKYIVE